MGFTTAILAVVGLAATKRFAGTIRYYITSKGLYCAADPGIQCVYIYNGINTCQTSLSSRPTLYTIGPSGIKGTTSKCTNALTYDATGE